MHGLLPKPYDATDACPESGASQSTDGGQEDHSRAIDFAQVFFRNALIMSVYGIKGISVAVR